MENVLLVFVILISINVDLRAIAQPHVISCRKIQTRL